MSYSLGSATITPGVKGTFTTVNSGIQGIIIGNLSGYSLSVQLEGGATAKTLYPGTADFFSWFIGFSGVIFWTTTSTVNVQNIPGASITFDAVGKIENFNASAYPMSIAVVQSVNPTATGNPIFSTSFGVGSSAGNNQSVNIFNPANSGVNCVFYLAQGFTNSAGVPTANLIYLSGADLNFSGPATAKSHTGTANPPVSVCHVTTDDSNNAFGGVAIRVVRLTGSSAMATSELLPFPSVFTLTPGGNLRLSVADTTSGHVVEVNLDWTEITQVPPLTILGPGMVANAIKNDGNPVGTSIIESTPTGAPQALNIFNDGSGSWIVDQSGVAHKVFTFNTVGNPLQLGQAGDITEIIGALTSDQSFIATLTAVINGLLTAQAGVVVNGSRNPTIDLSAATGTQQIKFAHGGWTSTQMIGDTTIANAGTSVAHALGVIPDVVIPVHDLGAANADVIGVNYGTLSSTNFTAYSSNAGGSGNVRFFVGKF